jgi:hypothetical protein
MTTALKDGKTLLFIGDSITDCGRRDDRIRPLRLVDAVDDPVQPPRVRRR